MKDNNKSEIDAEAKASSEANVSKFIRKNTSCKIGIHRCQISELGKAHNCHDCGKYFPALPVPKMPKSC